MYMYMYMYMYIFMNDEIHNVGKWLPDDGYETSRGPK
jgi:hypothetical protein